MLVAIEQSSTDRASSVYSSLTIYALQNIPVALSDPEPELDDDSDENTNDANITKRCSSHLGSDREAGTGDASDNDDDLQTASSESNVDTPSMDTPNQVAASKSIKRKADSGGIDTHNIITPSFRASNGSDPSVNNNESPRKSQRLPRGHGQRTVDYDMKYHPMDDFLRPGCSAKSRTSRKQNPETPSESDGETGDDTEEKALSKRVALPIPHRRRSSRNIHLSGQPIYSAEWHPLDQMLKDNASSQKALEDRIRSKTTGKSSESSTLKDEEEFSIITSDFDSNLDADKASQVEGKIALIYPNQRRSTRVLSSKVEAPNYNMKYSGLTQK